MQRGQWSEVTAIASRDPEKARGSSGTAGNSESLRFIRRFLADADIDAIYNPLPNRSARSVER